MLCEMDTKYRGKRLLHILYSYLYIPRYFFQNASRLCGSVNSKIACLIKQISEHYLRLRNGKVPLKMMYLLEYTLTVVFTANSPCL